MQVDAANHAAACNLLAAQSQATGTSSPQGKVRKSPAKAAGGASAAPPHAVQPEVRRQPRKPDQCPSGTGCYHAGDAAQDTPQDTLMDPLAAQAQAGDPPGRLPRNSQGAAAVNDAVGLEMPGHTSGRHGLQSVPCSSVRFEGQKAPGNDTASSADVALATHVETQWTTAASPDGQEAQPAIGNRSKDTQAPRQDIKQHLDILTWLPLVPAASQGLAVQAEKSGSLNVHFNVVHRSNLVPDG